MPATRSWTSAPTAPTPSTIPTMPPRSPRPCPWARSIADSRLRDRHRHDHRRQQGAGDPGGPLQRRLHRAHEPRAQRRQCPGPGRTPDRARDRIRDPARLARDVLCRRPSRPPRGQDRGDGARGRAGAGRGMSRLEQVDPEIARAIRDETVRQSRNLELIASENFVSEAVLEATGSVMTNKYAEGYPGKRYYGGCEIVDIAENLAISRARQLFGAEHVNVQPHSGSQANMAVYFTLLKPGDIVHVRLRARVGQREVHR